MCGVIPAPEGVDTDAWRSVQFSALTLFSSPNRLLDKRDKFSVEGVGVGPRGTKEVRAGRGEQGVGPASSFSSTCRCSTCSPADLGQHLPQPVTIILLSTPTPSCSPVHPVPPRIIHQGSSLCSPTDLRFREGEPRGLDGGGQGTWWITEAIA